MAEKKRCIRCGRAIDSVARICPFCNWDQSDLAVPGPEQVAAEQAQYAPPVERPWRRYALMAVGGVVLLIAAFALGSKLQGSKPPVRGMDQNQTAEKTTSDKTSTAPSRPAPHADVMLVPVNANDTVAVEQPITSAPVPTQTQGVPSEYQRSDATAVSSVEYAQLAARAAAEKKAQADAAKVTDPRSLKGPAYAQGPPQSPKQPPQMSSSPEQQQSLTVTVPFGGSEPSPAQPSAPAAAPPRERGATTRAVPEYQPVPDIQVAQSTIVRLKLTVGADGRVKEVEVLQGIPGQMAKIISTVQTWRFKPATENGEPVPSPFTVDLSFRGQ